MQRKQLPQADVTISFGDQPMGRHGRPTYYKPMLSVEQQAAAERAAQTKLQARLDKRKRQAERQLKGMSHDG